jgi:putative ABC transport system permease protein
VRQGLLALARPGAAAVSACVALGIGILLVLGMRLVELGLTGALRSQLPQDAPSAFLVDIQPHQWSGVEGLLAERGARDVVSVPVVSARLRSVDGVAVQELVEGEGRSDRRWGLTREQRLTYMQRLPEDNRIVAGALWSRPGVAEVSLEREFAEETGLDLDSVLLFEIQGVPIELTVSSLRTVEWRTFGINFFMVVEPGALDDAPQTRVATARLPQGSEQQVQDALAAAFPNITLLRIRAILERVAAVLERLALGVRFLGGFTVLAGIVILASAVSAAAAQRGRETALLKTLGMTRAQIVVQSATEHLAIGLLAATVGSVGGNLLAWAVLTRGMELEWAFRPGTTLIAASGCVVLTTVTALAAGWPALTERPLAVLRER